MTDPQTQLLRATAKAVEALLVVEMTQRGDPRAALIDHLGAVNEALRTYDRKHPSVEALLDR